MSGEIKILFYIIVGIVYLISTFYGKEKKKQSQRDVNRKPVDNQTAEDIFEELRKSILPASEPAEDLKLPEKSHRKKTERQPEITNNYRDFLKHKKKPVEDTFIEEAHFRQDDSAKNMNIVENVESKPEINFDEMDARKALIYGEIFRRPQY
jgi:hypothetical protein